MITEEEILNTLDRSKDEIYNTFIWLGDVYSYLIDSRLNILSDNIKNWAIVAERLGYNPRAGAVEVQISYYGNCINNIDEYSGKKLNYYSFSPIDRESFLSASSENESLNKNAKSIKVRGIEVPISRKKEDYINARIPLMELEKNELNWEEVMRLLIINYSELFRATDKEIYKSIPNFLKKILVIDEWYHKDFELLMEPEIHESQLMQAYKSSNLEIEYDSFKELIKMQKIKNDKWNNLQWEDNRPSSYETWQLIAKVISTGDSSKYNPKLNPNSHWRNWEESGTF